MNAADKSSDILEVDVESLDDNILEGAGATLGTGDLEVDAPIPTIQVQGN